MTSTAIAAPPVAPFTLTIEQEAILLAGTTTNTSLMIDALAGTGKSKTLELLAAAICKAQPKLLGLALAFNKKIAKELETRLPGSFQVMTMNGLGHRAWGKAIGKNLTIDDRKVGRLVSAIISAHKLDLPADGWDTARRLVTLAMQAGLVPKPYPHRGLIPDSYESWRALAEDDWLEADDQILWLAREVLIASIKEGFSGTISFDDQIYLSCMFNGVFPKFPLVLVDEAQDLSSMNHLMLKRVASNRLIVAGDPRQAIYSFRGADSLSMTNLARLRSEWIHLTLSTTFRCPKAIVERQWHHAPAYTAAPGNAAGKVHNLTHQGWTWAKVQGLAKGDIFILCRNNAPLLSMAFKLLRQQVPFSMLGRDIGKGLVALSKKILPHADTLAANCVGLIGTWEAEKVSLAQANGKEEKVAGIRDRAECLRAVLDGSGCKDAGALRAALESLFAKDNTQVTLGTGHRAKGLERNTIIHLDPWRIPSKWALQQKAQGNPAALGQEINLAYVIETRAQEVLIEASLSDFQGA